MYLTISTALLLLISVGTFWPSNGLKSTGEHDFQACQGLLGKFLGCTGSLDRTTIKSEMVLELNSSSTYQSLLDVLKATRRAINYFANNLDSLNLDGAATAKVAQGQLQAVQNKFNNFSGLQNLSPKSKEVLNEDITNLKNSLAEIATAVGPKLEQSSKEYYQQMKPLLDGEWLFDYPTRVTNSSYLYQRKNLVSDFNESFSDSCYSELIGTNENAGKPCAPSKKCWEYQTAANTRDYRLTHEVLYLQIAEMFGGCAEAIKLLVEEAKQESTAHLLDIFCANILRDMKEESSNGIKLDYRDLFMEQSFFCGMMGYRDFVSPSWLKSILSWQKPEGCYGLAGDKEIQDFAVYQLKKYVKSLGVNLEKREEQIMENWCLSHQTGVALNALVMYLSFLLEDPSLSFEINTVVT